MSISKRARRLLGRVLLLVGILGFLAAIASPAPYVIEMPGPVFNAMGSLDGRKVIIIKGADTYETKDRFDALTVQTRGKPAFPTTWVEVFLAMLDNEKVVVPMESVYPQGVTQEEENKITTQMMLDSQRDAIAVALKAQGYKFTSYPAVDSLRKKSPADGVLKVDDKIISVDGKPTELYEDISGAVKASGGKSLEFNIERAGKELSLSLKPVKETDGEYRIGIYVGYRYDFPVSIDVYLGDVSGPSAGLMFALSILDLMTPGDLSGGNHVAGTGTISPDGQVGQIGGIRLKMIAARNAGAKYFLAPKSNCTDIVGHVPKGLIVRAVDTFDDALGVLSDMEQSIPISPVLNCSTK
jgi:PDZ domain-containing protein